MVKLTTCTVVWVLAVMRYRRLNLAVWCRCCGGHRLCSAGPHLRVQCQGHLQDWRLCCLAPEQDTHNPIYPCRAGAVVGISCAVLVLIFDFQRLGTSKIGFSYAPILLLWFTCNAAVGCYNIATSDPAIFRVSESACPSKQVLVLLLSGAPPECLAACCQIFCQASCVHKIDPCAYLM